MLLSQIKKYLAEVCMYYDKKVMIICWIKQSDRKDSVQKKC